MEKRSIAENSKMNQMKGNQYGELKVLDVFRDNKGKYRCECRCSCGNVTYPLYTNVPTGRTKSCGCGEEKNRRKYVDLTGKRFGKLVAMEPTSFRQDGCVIWKCACDCGKACYKMERNLVRGFSTHCGCSKKKNKVYYYKDLTGQRFHRLLVVAKTELRAVNGSIIWQCRCDCGKEIHVSESDLVHGNRQSCGCRRLEMGRELIQYRHFEDGTCLEALTRKKRSDNKSGYTGVFELSNGKYKAGITFKGERYYLGTFDKKANAIKARQLAEETFHKPFIDKWSVLTEQNTKGGYNIT
ncbi:MAG: hypothetical protein PHW34_01940 [Hespellia sp.]|nr:hypothetical protein [Hespellia sp.]